MQKHSPRRARGPVTGTIQVTSRGFGFLLREDEEDWFIAIDAMHGAMHGDTVRVRPLGFSRGSMEGEVVEILDRAWKEIVGVMQDGCAVEPRICRVSAISTDR